MINLQNRKKTALNVVTLLLPVMDILVSTRQHELVGEHNTKINRLQVSVRNNEYAHDNLEQYTRRENLRLSNIPEADDENLVQVIIDIGKELGVNIEPSCISAVHRLGVKRAGKVRQVLVRFVNRESRMQYITRRKELKNSEHFKDVFISEDLTKLRFKLFQLVRKLDIVKNAFTRDGKIHGVLKSGAKFMIESPDDLFKIGVDEIDNKALGLAEL